MFSPEHSSFSFIRRPPISRGRGVGSAIQLNLSGSGIKRRWPFSIT
jgi:hypothetical protein